MITITDEILLAALRGQSYCCVDCGCKNPCSLQEHFTDTEQSEMRAALTAVAPLIEREVLERAAKKVYEKQLTIYTPTGKVSTQHAEGIANDMLSDLAAAIRSLASEVQGGETP